MEEKNEKLKEETKTKKSFLNNKKTVKGKALTAWIIVIIIIAMIVTFGSGLIVGKLLYEGKNKKSNTVIDNTNTETNTNTEPTTPDKPLETFDLANFDSTKIINKGENEAYESKVNGVSSNLVLNKDIQTELIGTKISDDKRSVTVTINWANLKEIYFQLNGTTTSEYSISFDKNVREVYVSGWGQGWGQETIFYLMEDGTIEYTPISSKVITNLAGSIESFVLKSYGAVPNVEGVVILAMGNVYPTNSPYGGGMALLGIKSTGDFYDLSSILGGTELYR